MLLFTPPRIHSQATLKNYRTMKNKLIEVINNPRSVVELYLSDDCSSITEVKCLSDNRVKEYTYPVDSFFRRTGVSRELKNKIALAMAN